jgi:hypothetical protein
MRVLPSPQAITRMEETITWNRFLERDECHLMWARVEGTPWKHLCHRFGISRRRTCGTTTRSASSRGG